MVLWFLLLGEKVEKEHQAHLAVLAAMVGPEAVAELLAEHLEAQMAQVVMAETEANTAAEAAAVKLMEQAQAAMGDEVLAAVVALEIIIIRAISEPAARLILEVVLAELVVPPKVKEL